MTFEFFALVGIGFFAQLVDGALGMAFGLISTTALLFLGVPPAQASAAVHTAEVVTTGASGLSHLYHRNINRGLLVTLATAGVLGSVLGAYVLSNIEGRALRSHKTLGNLTDFNKGLAGAPAEEHCCADANRTR